jgi:hypothetical protein
MTVFNDMFALYFHGSVILVFFAIAVQLRIWGVLDDEP